MNTSIESEHLVDYSPEEDCRSRQPVRKPYSAAGTKHKSQVIVLPDPYQYRKYP